MGRLAAWNTGARAGPGLGHSESIVIPKAFLRNPVGPSQGQRVRLGLRPGAAAKASSKAKAKAEAEATRLVSDAVRDGDIQALNYFVATKYTEALQAIASADNQKLVLMPLEASALIGSLGGIGELAKGILDKD